MNIAAIARESELLAETAAERTTLELAGNDLLVRTGELRSGPNGRVASFAKHAEERQVIATPYRSVRLWNSANVSELVGTNRCLSRRAGDGRSHIVPLKGLPFSLMP